MNLKKNPGKPKKLEEVDRLFLNELNNLIKTSTENFEKYEYSRCKNDTARFFWQIFADNYLELVKHRVYNGNRQEKQSAFYTLYNSLFTILKLMAPITPFITEEIYQTYYNSEKEKSIHLCSWPVEFKFEKKEEDKEKFNLLLEIISKIRQIKSKNQKSVKAEIILDLDKKTQDKLKNMIKDLKAVVNAKEIRRGKFGLRFV